jgi:hypothetical protein
LLGFCWVESIAVGVVHGLSVAFCCSDDFHVRATRFLRDDDVSTVTSGFHFVFNDFVAFGFVSIHHHSLAIVSI